MTYPFMFIVKRHSEDYYCRKCLVVANLIEASSEQFDKPFLECPKCLVKDWYYGDPRE
jgi:hypothetical protein